MLKTQNNLTQFSNKHKLHPKICIQLLNLCNLNCLYCISNSSSKMKESLDYEILVKLLKKLREYGKWSISLTGGEPFIWNDIRSLLIFLFEMDFDFSITTNGFSSINTFNTIPKNVWEKCKLNVSIDGNLQTHNFLRKNKSFENAIEFIKIAKPFVKNLNVNTVLFTNPRLWAKELYEILNNLNVTKWTIISPIKQGRWFKDILIEESYLEQYNYIKSIADKKTSTYYLDSFEKSQVLTDKVFIDSDGSIRLPGYFNTQNEEYQPLSTITNINDVEIVSKVIESVNNFSNSEKYTL